MPQGLGTLSLTANGDLRLPQSHEPVTVRFRASGTLHIVGRNGGRKIKKIWQELNVAPWLRDSTPLLFYGETLVAAAGVFVTLDGMDESGKGVQLEWKA
ncbi:tRNA(Ile)-lysidine synthase [compost metagenome]